MVVVFRCAPLKPPKAITASESCLSSSGSTSELRRTLERKKVRRNLERYCGQDTEGMIWIVDELCRLCG